MQRRWRVHGLPPFSRAIASPTTCSFDAYSTANPGWTLLLGSARKISRNCAEGSIDFRRFRSKAAITLRRKVYGAALIRPDDKAARGARDN